MHVIHVDTCMLHMWTCGCTCGYMWTHVHVKRETCTVMYKLYVFVLCITCITQLQIAFRAGLLQDCEVSFRSGSSQY